ncbi:MAG: endopeptidase La [Alphaproteobacteria bacterium]
MFGIKKNHRYPVLPLRDITVFPYMIVPLFVGREKSVNALEDVMLGTEKHIILLTQKNAGNDNPTTNDLYTYGTLATVLQILKLPDNTVKVLVEGIERIKILEFSEDNGYFEATAEATTPPKPPGGVLSEGDAIVRTLLGQFEQYIKLNRKIPPDVLVTINQLDDPSRLADTIASYLLLKISDKQEILETVDVGKRLDKLINYVESEISVLSVESRIRTRVKRQMEKTQRDYYLNEQLKAIQKEIGENEEGRDEIGELEDQIRRLKLTKEARTKCAAELKKLRTMNQMSAEATVVRNYLDWMVSIPWQQRTRIKRDILVAKETLDRDHYGLEKVKERMLEYLAVQSRVGKVRGQILCLVGPPGVGKTSLGKSIAKATGRNFVRISLGGVRDEAEIRGHRRTYIGSMPGKIIQGMKKAKTSNPLFLLDEIDKLGSDWRGDPSSALLEVLDPEQNSSFNDHYLEVDYDLSDVMFVTTANTLKMPQPLLDRMEIIRLPGYTEEEKIAIAEKHLLQKQLEVHGLKKGEFSITSEALRDLIRSYTRESGVRNLERELANLARKAIKEILLGVTKSVKITPKNLRKYAGITRFTWGQAELEDLVGVTTGLAWTEVGGELLSIEAVVLPGKGNIKITGKLGDVMQESVQAAVSYVRSRSKQFGIKPTVFEKRDIHVHVPEGATQKDGPSAGVAMYTSIVSALTGIPVRRDVAMTGEITLRGRVLAIGGLKEKLLAAHRGGIKTVIIPIDNEKDLEDIPDNVKKGLKLMPVTTVDEVLKIAFVRVPIAIEWEDQRKEEDIISPRKITIEDEATSRLPH